MTGLSSFTRPLHHASAIAFGLTLACSALAETTTLTVGDVAKGTSNVPVTMLFPVTRSGDTTYDTVLSYHTEDGSALEGYEYTGISASTIVPAGSSLATIPVTIAAAPGTGPNRNFNMVLVSATGIGRSPGFAAQQTLATGHWPSSVTQADVNGDGKADLIVADYDDHAVSVRLNTTAPGAPAPSFTEPQTFATPFHPAAVIAADVNGDGRPDLIVATADSNKTISVLLNTTVSGAGTPSFAAQQTFASGSGPRSVCTADINGDGKPDLIVANNYDSTISVLLNTTTPGAAASFAAQQTFATGLYPSSVTSADINGDGKPDLIVANNGSNTVSAWINTTAPGAAVPSFSAQQTFATQSYPASATITDINGDGKPDLIIANNGSSSVSVLLNTTNPGATTPSFASQHMFATGSGPASVITADLNGDGKRDLIATNYEDGTISVRLNTTAPGAAAGFAAAQTYAVGSGPASAVAVDVNGDGKLDLVVANNGTNNLSVLVNTTTPASAAPGLMPQHVFAIGWYPYAITAADLNGDGKPELILTNSESATVSVLLNDTTPGASVPAFAERQPFSTASGPVGVVAADVNGDGRLDLAITCNLASEVTVLLNTTAPGAATLAFAAPQTFNTGSGPYAIASADINSDGKPDLIVANYDNSTVSVLFNTTAPGAAAPTFAAQQTFATGSQPFFVTVADVNGDGRPDLISANSAGDTVSVLVNTTAAGASTPTFVGQQTFNTGSYPVAVIAADVNGDGKPDLVAANFYAGSVSVLLNATTPGAAAVQFAAQAPFLTGTNPVSLSAVDIDGDGRVDLVATNGGAKTLSTLLNTTAPGAIAPSFATQQTFATGSTPMSVTSADINGDGKRDLIVTNRSDSSVSVLLNAQYLGSIAGSPATGTIVRDYVFVSGFE